MKGLKRVWKKGTALFLSLALALTLCIGMNVTALANDETVSASSVDAYWSITVGEPDDGEITVTIGLLKDITVTGGTFKLQFNSDYFTMPTTTDTDGYTVGVLTTCPDKFASNASVGTNGTISYTASDIINGDTFAATDTFLVYTLYYDNTIDIEGAEFSFAVTELYDENVDDITDALGTVSADLVDITHTHAYTDAPTFTWADDYSSAAAVFACTVQDNCDETLSVDATVTSVTTAATCESGGYTTYTATATYNETEYTETKVVDGDEAIGHSFAVDTGATVWASDYSTATLTLVCANDTSHTVTLEDVTVTSTTSEATCEEAGYTLYTAAGVFDSIAYTDTISVPIPATGHSYDPDTISWSWASDYSSATATLTCENDESHTISYDAEITSETTGSVCTDGISTTYTATVTIEETAYTDSVTVAEDATGHSYDTDNITWTWSADYSSASASFICTQGDDTQTVDAVVTSQTTAASCETEGSIVYTATATFENVEYSTTATVEIAATGHDYDTENATWTWAEDYSSATATVVCKNDSSHTYTVTAEVTSVTNEATETVDGSIVYTALAVVDGNTITSTTTVTIPATGTSEENGSGDEDSNGGDGSDSDGSGSDDGSDSDGGSDGGDGSDSDGGSDSGDGSGSDSGSGSDDGSGSGSGSGSDDGSGSGSGSVSGTTPGSSYSVPTTKIAAEKVSLTGATEEQVTATLQMLTNDGDLADSTYSLLQAKATNVKKTSMKVTWKKVSGAVTYVVYANQCGKGKKLKKLKTTTKTSLNVKKIAGKKVKSGKYYKFLVVALDENGEVIATSKTIHSATKGGKVTNEKSVTLYKSGKKVSAVTLKAGKSAKLTAKTTKQEKAKTLQQHRKVKYESSNTNIATVSNKGRIKAKAKGTCYIYAYAQNGVAKKIKVTVK